MKYKALKTGRTTHKCGMQTHSLRHSWRLALVLHAKARNKTKLLKFLQLVKVAKVKRMEGTKI